MPAAPVNVLYVNPTSAWSGGESSLLASMGSLDPERFRPLLVVPDLRGRFAQKALDAGIDTFAAPRMIAFGEPAGVSSLPRLAASALGLARLARRERARIVHSNSPRTAYQAGLAARLAGAVSFVHVRDIHLSPFASPRKARLLGLLADRILAVSGAVRESIVEATPSLARKVRVLHNGLRLEEIDAAPRRDLRAELGIDPAAPVLVQVGIPHPAKGQEVLLRAISILRPELPGLRTFFVGGPLRPEDAGHLRDLRALAARLGVGSAVTFTGFRDDVLDLVAAADVVVHPAVYPEPFPRCLLEALALAKPVAASRVGGVPELVEDGVTGRLVPPGDPGALAAAVAALLKDRPQARRLGQAGRRKVEAEFSLERHAAALAAEYRAAMRGRA